MPVSRHLPLQAFVDQPLMGGVLVDDDDAGRRLGDDVVFMHLRAGGAQRRRLVRRLRSLGLEARRRRFGKAGGLERRSRARRRRGAGRSIW